MFGEGMKFAKKWGLIGIILASISVYLSFYTWRAHIISRRIIENPDDEAVAWRSAPSGSLFPWPREPGMLQILSNINEVDSFIYKYLIKSWVLVALSVLMWVGTGMSIFKCVRLLETEKGER